MNLSNFDFHYHVEVDYDRTSCVCYDSDDYCRCTQIINARVNTSHLSYRDVLTKVTKLKNDIRSYCLDRVFSGYFKNVSSDDFDVDVCGGYYGEEIASVYLKAPELNKTIKLFEKCQNDRERIEFVLKYEYGFLLDDAKDLSWSIERVQRSEIRLPNRDYSRKLDRKIIEMYQDYSLPIGVFIGDRLIDGYHRTTAFLNGNKKSALIVRGTK